ncbi:MAG TPA: class I SAM-dependent methyltransferase, partial [Thermoanaerobaculia bacterium]|nr:class I SAM-dependent methyltransferase [Thermoanaerobaculia bacterium]
MTIGSTSSYDEVPYSDRCFFMTHPDHLATLAMVHGVPAPPVERCRVLELGCARGGNLLPMALELPESSFVGVDLSVRQIDEARENAARLGLKNVVLHAMSLTDIDSSFGLFDYIVCHGVYSWVPDVVRERILSICSENLSPNGLAFVSYNTYPGWHERGVVRDLMLYHSRQATSPTDRLAMARGIVDRLAEVLPNPASPYGSNLRTEAELLREVSDTYLYHEFLEEENQPTYVHEFLTRAARFGLEFVAEALTAGLLPGLPAPAQDAIARWAVDSISREQYLDLVCNRAFRQTVLRRAGGLAATGRSPEVIASLSVATVAMPSVPDPVVTDDSTVEFVRPGKGSSATTNRPVVKAALLTLYEARPRALDFESLWAGVVDRLGGPDRP